MTKPLRREVHVPIYWLIVGLAVMVGSPLAALFTSVQINERTTARAIAAAEVAKQEARAESTLRYCRLLGSQVDVYSEATSPVGKDAYNTWLAEYRLQGCKPGR